MRRTRAGSRIAWIVLGLVAVSALVIGALRAGGASTPEERIDAIARTVKCPVCPGESVYESRNSVALNIKADIAREVRAGQTDDQIRADLSARYGESVLLVPRADGIGAAVWVLPVALCPKTPMLLSGLRKAATLSPVLALEAITRASGEAARDRCARA